MTGVQTCALPISWDLFTNDEIEETDNYQDMFSSRNSNLWYENEEMAQINNNNEFQNSPGYSNIAESAPPYNRFLMPQLKPNQFNKFGTRFFSKFCSIQTHPNKILIVSFEDSVNVKIGDFVLFEVDKGYDIGEVLAMIENPSLKDTKNARKIIRKASKMEIERIPRKEEMERNALEICQMKVKELGLPMLITDAEYQMDGKKLTFYYTASKYVDFRNLVRVLFKTFSTRIWMVWHDGNVPVKDVFTRGEVSNIKGQ